MDDSLRDTPTVHVYGGRCYELDAEDVELRGVEPQEVILTIDIHEATKGKLDEFGGLVYSVSPMRTVKLRKRPKKGNVWSWG